MDIKSIKVPYQIKNINIEGSNNISKPYASGKRNVFAYIDIIKGVGTLYLTDTTQGKASGRRILPSEKSRIIKYINTLFTLKDDNRKPLLEYDRYVDAPAKAGQLNSKLKLNKNLMNPNGIKADDLIVECENPILQVLFLMTNLLCDSQFLYKIELGQKYFLPQNFLVYINWHC